MSYSDVKEPIDEIPEDHALAQNRDLLLVMDDGAIRDVMSHVLKDMDFNIQFTCASNINEAMDVLANKKFHLVIADEFLGNSSTGFSLWVHCHVNFPYTPFILMSSMDTEEYLELTKGIKDRPALLPKPFLISDCREFIHSHLLDWSAHLAG
jgi:DNA-binding NtrC family response regulator